MYKEFICPIHNSANCISKVNSFCTKRIVQLYKEQYKTDVSEFFIGLDSVFLIRCDKTGYQYFIPNSLIGNAEFYNQISKTDDYYIDWKWEHEQGLKLVTKDKEILEIGSGNGQFLKKAVRIAKKCTSIDIGSQNVTYHGIDHYTGNFIELLKDTENKYDCIFMFQILEHCYDINTIFPLLYRSLKQNGKLFIGLPNNDSFILKNDIDCVLNFPPHHIGWWTPDSIKAVAEYFNFKTIKQKPEPLQKYHYERYYFLKAQQFRTNYGFFGKLADKFFFIFKNPILNILNKKIKGHTFISIFERV